MKEIQYKTFSLKTHKKNWQKKKPNVCQFELTFGCGLRCSHCYTDCYNQPQYLKRELSTQQIKLILDKVYNAGVIWLCFSGGDPLTRPDFLELYAYAKDKGFIISVFTNSCSMTEKFARYLKKRPPFVVEMTLNGITKETYERISQVTGSFKRVMRGISLMLKAGIPLKIKTQVTKENLSELPKIKSFIQGKRMKFMPSILLHARLNGDLAPCHLRLELEDALSLDGKRSLLTDEGCQGSKAQKVDAGIFSCAIGGGDGIYLDPYGNIVPCDSIREPKINLLKEDILGAREKILSWVREANFKHESKCSLCALQDLCYNCPGKAWLEKKSLTEPVEWFCEVAHAKEKVFT